MDANTASDTKSAHSHLLTLTRRETAVLCAIAAGLTTLETAQRLHVSHHTVAQHISDMMNRARAKSRGELIARAYAQGILATGVWPPQEHVRFRTAAGKTPLRTLSRVPS